MIAAMLWVLLRPIRRIRRRYDDWRTRRRLAPRWAVYADPCRTYAPRIVALFRNRPTAERFAEQLATINRRAACTAGRSRSHRYYIGRLG